MLTIPHNLRLGHVSALKSTRHGTGHARIGADVMGGWNSLLLSFFGREQLSTEMRSIFILRLKASNGYGSIVRYVDVCESR